MNELLGVIDALEACITEGKRVPLSGSVLVKEQQVLGLIDKMRLLAKNGSRQTARDAIELQKGDGNTEQSDSDPARQSAVAMVMEAKKEAENIEKEANHYAEQVLAKLQLLVTKMQKNLIRLEKNVEEGRLNLDVSSPVRIIEKTDEVVEL